MEALERVARDFRQVGESAKDGNVAGKHRISAVEDASRRRVEMRGS